MDWFLLLLGLLVMTAAATFAQRSDAQTVPVASAQRILNRDSPAADEADVRAIAAMVRRSSYALNVPLALIGGLVVGRAATS